MFKRYLLYLLRWQLSTPILAPVIAWFKHSPSPFGTASDWAGSMVANLIGGLLFFWVDRFIFAVRGLEMPLWTVKTRALCCDCGRESRVYRLVKAADYDRTKVATPEYRCEECSMHKADVLQSRGVVLE